MCEYSKPPLYCGSVFMVPVLLVFFCKTLILISGIFLPLQHSAVLFTSLNLALHDKIAIRTDSTNQSVGIVFSAADWLLCSRNISLLALLCLNSIALALNIFYVFKCVSIVLKVCLKTLKCF